LRDLFERKIIFFNFIVFFRAWAWTLWELEVEIPKDQDELRILCVATDSNENTQPETVKSLWNLRGLLNNSWHTITIKLK
jgi:sulfite oxidase